MSIDKNVKIFFIVFLLFNSIGLVQDTIYYFESEFTILTVINCVNVFIVLAGSVFFFFRLLSIRLFNLIFVYFLAANIIHSDIFNILNRITEWEAMLFRNAFVYAILIVTVGLINTRPHIYILNTMYLIFLIAAYSISPSNFFTNNVFILGVMVTGFSIALVLFLKTIERESKYRLTAQNNLFIQKQKIAATESKLFREKSENLIKIVEQKDKELLSSALAISQTNETMNLVLNDLKKLAKNTTNSKDLTLIKNLINTINTSRFDVGMDLFLQRFNEINYDFCENLKIKFPDLSDKEIQLAAFIRMGLSSKQIASLIYSTKKSVDVSRSRLRKKMRLRRADNLKDFLNAI